MNSQSFSLQPFHPDGTLPDVKITGNISRYSDTIAIDYELLGPLSKLLIPSPADMPARKNSLWEETCFEFFLGVRDSDQYWEFNLSPAGHWNVYRFKAYRKEMQEERIIATLPYSIHTRSDALLINLELNLDRIVPAEQPLNAAISAVIKGIDGKVTYWALTHSRPEADFHRRDSFIIEL